MLLIGAPYPHVVVWLISFPAKIVAVKRNLAAGSEQILIHNTRRDLFSFFFVENYTTGDYDYTEKAGTMMKCYHTFSLKGVNIFFSRKIPVQTTSECHFSEITSTFIFKRRLKRVHLTLTDSLPVWVCLNKLAACYHQIGPKVMIISTDSDWNTVRTSRKSPHVSDRDEHQRAARGRTSHRQRAECPQFNLL